MPHVFTECNSWLTIYFFKYLCVVEADDKHNNVKLEHGTSKKRKSSIQKESVSDDANAKKGKNKHSFF